MVRLYCRVTLQCVHLIASGASNTLQTLHIHTVISVNQKLNAIYMYSSGLHPTCLYHKISQAMQQRTLITLTQPNQNLEHNSPSSSSALRYKNYSCNCNL